MEHAGIEDLHIHDLRRSLVSYMTSTGANVALIKNALNHKDIQTTLNVYVRTAKDAEREARDRAHEHMFGAKNKPTIFLAPIAIICSQTGRLSTHFRDAAFYLPSQPVKIAGIVFRTKLLQDQIPICTNHLSCLCQYFIQQVCNLCSLSAKANEWNRGK